MERPRGVEQSATQGSQVGGDGGEGFADAAEEVESFFSQINASGGGGILTQLGIEGIKRTDYGFLSRRRP